MRGSWPVCEGASGGRDVTIVSGSDGSRRTVGARRQVIRGPPVQQVPSSRPLSAVVLRDVGGTYVRLASNRMMKT